MSFVTSIRSMSSAHIYIIIRYINYVYHTLRSVLCHICNMYDYDFKESERYHSIGSPMGGAPPSPKTNRDYLIKDNLGRYCPKTFKTTKGKKEKWCRRESNPGPLA